MSSVSALGKRSLVTCGAGSIASPTRRPRRQSLHRPLRTLALLRSESSRTIPPSPVHPVAGELIMDRRHFLSTAATGMAATLALPGTLLAQLDKAPALPSRSLLDQNEDAFWAEMRRQFVIPEDEIFLNNGTVGSSPLPVLRAIFEAYNTTEKMDQQDPEDYPIWGYASWNEFRDPLAEFIGCTHDELALLRNATEANSYIANGVDLKPGDEVLMTDQEHPGGEHPWNLKAKRYGVVVKRVTLPRPVKDAAQVLNLFNDAITPRTRVLFFSHMTTFSGVVLPARS